MTTHTDYKKIILRLEISEPSSDLSERICARIDHARIVRDRLHITAHSIIIVSSIALFIPALQYASTEASTSGFYDYLSLIISDGSYLLSSWREITLSILESAPLMGTALSIGTLIIIANSLRRGSRYISPIRPILAFKN